MFSGIVERQGKLVRKDRQGKRLTLTFETLRKWDKPLKRGESIAVSGVCLTVVAISRNNWFTVQAVPETLAQTTLESLSLNEIVNLERSLKWGERIGGHFVLGHVDGVGRIARRHLKRNNLTLEIEVPPMLAQYLVSKGSVAVDGISLTVQKILGRKISIAVIPHTAKTTTLGKKKEGAKVNLEADVIAKNLALLVEPSNT